MGLFSFLGKRGPYVTDLQTGNKHKVSESAHIGTDREKCEIWIPEKFHSAYPDLKKVHAIIGLIGDHYVLGVVDAGAKLFYKDDDGWHIKADARQFARLDKTTEIQLGGMITELVNRRRLAEDLKARYGTQAAEPSTSEKLPKPGYMLRFEL